jgi:hypothetical protein
MDWYLIGRILGVIFWPLAVAAVVYGLGWAIALPRETHVAIAVKRWFRAAAIVGFVATLFVTVRDFLKYTGAVT